MAQDIDADSKSLPYRWGYFQGAILLPFSLMLVLGTVSALVESNPEPWYHTALACVIGLLGFPLGYGLLRKRSYALPLVYAMFGLTLLLAAVKLPIAIKNYADSGYSGSALFEAELVFVWLLSLVYYRKRKAFFH